MRNLLLRDKYNTCYVSCQVIFIIIFTRLKRRLTTIKKAARGLLFYIAVFLISCCTCLEPAVPFS
jgi:hypothetical protein